MASRTRPGPATLRLLETGIRCFLEGGFSVLLAALGCSWLLMRSRRFDSDVHGFVLQEVNLPFRDESELAVMTGAIMEAFPASEFPYLFEMTLKHVLQPGYDYSEEFDSGLAIVLDGITASLTR
jgi:Tetracyclin repressor-like, C-terminal domain